MKTYQKIDTAAPKDNVCYTSFYDQVLTKDWNWEEVDTDGDLILNIYNPFWVKPTKCPIGKKQLYYPFYKYFL